MRYLILLLVLTGCYEEDMNKKAKVFWWTGGNAAQVDPTSLVFVVLDMGQSNAIGRAESDRLALTLYSDIPQDVNLYYKPDYMVTNNGGFQFYSAGVNTEEPDQPGSLRLFSGSLSLATKLRDITQNPVYVIPAGDGGTALQQNLTTPDWSPNSTGECFQTFLEYYLQRAMAIVLANHPTKTVKVIINWTQGETDAANVSATTNYPTNFDAFYTAVRAFGTYSAYLTAAPWYITLIDYLQTADEATINSFFQTFEAGTGAGIVKTIDVSDQPRKIDLTVDQKGGFTPTASDDEHLSYLGQLARGERAYNNAKTFFNITQADPSEITSNTAFDPSTISSNGVRLQFSRSNVTIDATNNITAANNNLSLADFTTGASSSLRFKVDKRKGFGWFSPVTNSRIESDTPIGTSLFAGSWSMSAFCKPRSIGNVNTIFHDIQSTASPNNSRILVYIENTSGKVYGIVALGGTAVQFRTLNACFTAANLITEHHVAVTVTSGNLVRVYFDGVLQTLDAVLNGDVSALTLANYVNNTNKLQVGAIRSGASTYASHYVGMIRELTIQPVVYSQSQINNLRLN